jgi:hypothetical protein
MILSETFGRVALGGVAGMLAGLAMFILLTHKII